MLKAWARYGVGLAQCAGGKLERAERESADQLLVLCYHRILPPAAKASHVDPDLAVTPGALHAQCALLRDHYEVLPLSAAYARWSRGEAGGRPIAAITFDDGYRDNYVYARPVLLDLELRATYFVIGGLIGAERAPWYDRFGRACRAIGDEAVRKHLRDAGAEPPPHLRGTALLRTATEMCKGLAAPARDALVERLCELAGGDHCDARADVIMDTAELCALHQAGHEIAAHSATHPILTQLDDAALAREVAQPRAALRDLLGKAPDSFCYPNGDYNARVLDAVARAGYTVAATTRQGLNPPGVPSLELRRVFMHEARLARPWGGNSSSLTRREWTAYKHGSAGGKEEVRR